MAFDAQILKDLFFEVCLMEAREGLGESFINQLKYTLGTDKYEFIAGYNNTGVRVSKSGTNKKTYICVTQPADIQRLHEPLMVEACVFTEGHLVTDEEDWPIQNRFKKDDEMAELADFIRQQLDAAVEPATVLPNPKTWAQVVAGK